jgi:glucarate dehydratase
MDVRLAIRPLRDDDAGEVQRAVSLAAALGAAVAVPSTKGAAALPVPAVAPSLGAAPTLSEVRIYQIALPLRELYVSSMYLTDTQARTLVELRCADGTVGWGEAHGGAEVVQRIGVLANDWLGRDMLRDRAALRRRFARIGFNNRNGRNAVSAFAALELAAWDAAARHLGLPLGTMLGDARPEGEGSVEVASALPAAVPGTKVSRTELVAHMADTANVARVAELAADYAARCGVSAFKYKSAGTGPEWDLAALAALRQRLGPAARLRCDPNAAYGTEEALRFCRAAEPLGLEYHEDPTDGLEGMARLGAQIRTGLASNMCVIAPEHLAAAVRRGLRITVLGDLFLWGGVAGLCDMVRATRLLPGLTPAVHSFYETAVVTAANAHIALALALDDPHPMDCGWPGVAEDVVAPDALRIAGGRLFRPAGAGIGVVPEPERLAALATAEPIIVR